MGHAAAGLTLAADHRPPAVTLAGFLCPQPITRGPIFHPMRSDTEATPSRTQTGFARK